MAGYFDQCACGKYTCVGDTPCRKCLEGEITRLREALEVLAETRCGLAKTHQMECHLIEYVKDALEGGGE